MNKLVSFIISLALITGLVLAPAPVLVEALSTGVQPVISISGAASADASSGGGAIKNTVDTINRRLRTEYSWGTDFLTYSYQSSGKVVSISVNMDAYNKLNSAGKQGTMDIALSEIYNSNISRSAKNKIYNGISALDETTSALVRELSQDMRADFARGYAWFKPFTGPLGVVLGFLSIALFAAVGLAMLIDIAYITVPLAQSVLNYTKNGKECAHLVSKEAQLAVKEQLSKSDKEHVNVMGIYFRSRIPSLVALAICMLYLVSGEIYTVLANLMDLFRGLLG